MIVAIVAGAVAYVIGTTHTSPTIEVGGAASSAFNRSGELDGAAERALFSPDGSRLAVVATSGVGVARKGHIELVTPPGSSAVDAAWMPDSKALLIAEGPAGVDRLTALNLDGSVRGVAHLDTPITVGHGTGITVDSRGARAVVTTETRDPLGGARHFDLVLVDLESGRVSNLTDSPNVDETWPVFVGEHTVMFGRTEPGRDPTVRLLDVDTRIQQPLSPVGERAFPAGVVRGTDAVYTTGRAGHRAAIVQVVGQRRVRVGLLPAASQVWSVDPGGIRAVATVPTTDANGERTTAVRAVTLHPPNTG